MVKQRGCIGLLLIATLTIMSQKMLLSRVILAVNENSEYLNQWPYAAKSWKQLIGITPTLALIGDDSVQIDESLGEVIRFKPIEGMPTKNMAQIIRLLLPSLYPDDICIISDIDQIAVDKDYFQGSIKDFEDDKFILYRKFTQEEKNGFRRVLSFEEFWPMCYVAAKGTTFAEVFNIQLSSIDAIYDKLKKWIPMVAKHGWYSDQLLLSDYILHWKDYGASVEELNDHWQVNRVHVHDWNRNRNRIVSKKCIDIALAPFSKYEALLKETAKLLNLD